MFYSHQLLARKAPLGQIWMAATMHAKINRKKLNKLNIINICEEILNPSVPMALRLSGILMGGVVIVYERKVKLLYDDVNRLLVEINEAWKVKAAPDPTLLPKGKSQARYEAITLPEHGQADLGEIEPSLRSSDASTLMGFQQTSYIAMRLDSLNEPYINVNPNERDQSEHYHQADAANITLFEHFDSYQVDTGIHNRFERFDIEGDDETQQNFTPLEHTEISVSLIPSPPDKGPQKTDKILEQHPGDQSFLRSAEGKDTVQRRQDQQRQGPTRRRVRRTAPFAMDHEQTIIPGHIYQSWLQNASDVVHRRGRKRKHSDAMSSMKISHLMELPPVALICRLFAAGSREIHYPSPLLELWTKSIQPPHQSPSGRSSPPQPPQPSSSSPLEGVYYQDPLEFPHEDFHSGVGSQSLGVSIEKQRANLSNNMMGPDILLEEFKLNFVTDGVKATEANGVRVNESSVFVTPGNSGDEVRSITSSGSGLEFKSHNSEVDPGWSNKKRRYSSSKHSGNALEPVAEENSWQHPEPNFKLAKFSEYHHMPENDFFVETGPTQTQHFPITEPPVDHITDSIRMQLKTYFDTPGCPQRESLNQLAVGMNKKRAAHLFYQACVLATRDFIRVEQKIPYGEILISRGVKM